eukprot:3687049-Amphidinium_carterae.1
MAEASTPQLARRHEQGSHAAGKYAGSRHTGVAQAWDGHICYDKAAVVYRYLKRLDMTALGRKEVVVMGAH